ncbi:hypothetical protein LCM4579_19330 [Ensifer sp. LCM 4579]|nr:hypothetical protein LCM4579_19330 [Ensifer sp. LCM 4579]
MTIDQLRHALDNSLPVGICAEDCTVAAFGRAVTDHAVFAYRRDVVTLPTRRPALPPRGRHGGFSDHKRGKPAAALPRALLRMPQARLR